MLLSLRRSSGGVANFVLRAAMAVVTTIFVTSLLSSSNTIFVVKAQEEPELCLGKTKLETDLDFYNSIVSNNNLEQVGGNLTYVYMHACSRFYDVYVCMCVFFSISHTLTTKTTFRFSLSLF
jgi:hypothetical protein